MTITARHWAIVTTLAGIAALGTFAIFQNLPEVKAAGACAKNEAILLFELARTHADLDAVFGPIGSDCRPKVIAALDAVNTVDVWLFIPAYTAFVVFAAMFLSGGELRPLTWAAIAAAFFALGADYVETLNLLAYTLDLTPAPERLLESSSAAWIKFFSLALNALLLAAICFTITPRKRWILGVLLCLPIIGVTLMFVDLKWMQAQTLGFLLSWLPLLIMSAKTAVTGRT
jgi:hypothetical protein